MKVSVVIAAPGDDDASALVRTLTARGSPVLLLEPATLALARWHHAIDTNGRAATTIDLPGSLRIIDAEVGAVLWRAAAVPVPQFVRSAPADREYAAAEIGALVVSWLRGLGARVVNAVDGVSPVGPSWTPRRALVEARRAGLPVASSLIATSGRLLPGFAGSPYAARLPAERSPGAVTDTVLVVGGGAVGDLASRFGVGCVELARRAGCRVLEVGFTRDEGRFGVASVSPVPQLRDPRAVDAVAALLEGIALGFPASVAARA